MQRATTITWAALVLLTLVSFALGDSAAGRGVPLMILAAALLKSSLVGWQFMELRAAHALWKVGFLGLITAVAAALWLVRVTGAHS